VQWIWVLLLLLLLLLPLSFDQPPSGMASSNLKTSWDFVVG
jgi:hypothetical protein